MNKLCITLLLIFGIWFGWQRYAEHRAAQARKEHEAWAAYERCTSDFASCGNVSDQGYEACMKARADARKACMDSSFSAYR
jgi:predicted negative regulator of RcsB-dependent stress response